MKWELLGWLKYVGYTVLDYQPENVGIHHIYPCVQAGNGEPCIPQYYAMLYEQTKLQHSFPLVYIPRSLETYNLPYSSATTQ